MIFKIKSYLVQALEKTLLSLIFTIPIALILIELAYRERGYWAIGGEWFITLMIFIWGCKNGKVSLQNGYNADSRFNSRNATRRI